MLYISSRLLHVGYFQPPFSAIDQQGPPHAAGQALLDDKEKMGGAAGIGCHSGRNLVEMKECGNFYCYRSE